MSRNAGAAEQCARFLDGRGLTEEALKVATDTDYRFELAVQLGKLDLALDIAEEADSESKWRQLAELALSSSRLPVRLPISSCSQLPIRIYS